MRIDHAALFCRDLEQMRQFFIDYFDARSNEQYHNPRTGLCTYILSFTEGSTRLELMQRPDVQDADPSQPAIGYVHLSFAVGSKKGVDLLTRRLADYQRISDEVEKVSLKFSAEGLESAVAFFELVQFPVQGAYQMNRKFLMAQFNQELLAQGRTAEANWAARQAQIAYDSINTLNRRYNELLDGKWRGMMNLAPGWCALYQKMPEVTYTEGVGEKSVDLTPQRESIEGCCVINLEKFVEKSSDAQIVCGIGYDGQVMQLGTVTYQFPQVSTDSIDLVVYTVPFWPLYYGKSNAINISIDGGSPQVFENLFKEYDLTWKNQVLRNGATCRMRFAVDKSKPSHTIRFTATDPGQMLQRVIIDWGGLKKSYIGPEILKKETTPDGIVSYIVR